MVLKVVAGLAAYAFVDKQKGLLQQLQEKALFSKGLVVGTLKVICANTVSNQQTSDYNYTQILTGQSLLSISVLPCGPCPIVLPH